MPGAELQGGLDWFSSLLAHLRPFNAVIDAIAYQMRQGITNRFQDGFIKLHLLALDDQRDLLPQFLRKIAHHTLKLMEDMAQGLQARRHNGFLEFRGHEIDALAGGLDGWRIARRDGAETDRGIQAAQGPQRWRPDGPAGVPGRDPGDQ